jgi:signal transduction histidine kinase
LVVSGEPAAVGAAIERAACRIVQEALTNAARHAPGALVRVAIDRRDSALSIVVENGPPVRRPEAENGSGHGLQGMRERTTECGGALRAQPVSDGGFQVAASLPLSAP